jgi:hypothetical protein
MRRFSLRSAVLLLSFSAVGCDSALSPDDQPIAGAVSLRAVASGTRGAVTSGDAFFLTGSTLSVPDPQLVPDSCVVQPIDSSTTFNRGNTNAGNAIGLRINTTDGSMPLNTADGRYLIAPGTRLEYQFGDSVRITVPGQAGGFPAATAFARLAEPLTLSPFTVPALGQPGALRWSPAGTATSAVVLTIRFRPGSAGQAGRQALCSLRDDGSFDAPARVIDALRDAGVPDQIAIVRFRTSQADISRRATLFALSSFESVLPIGPR